MATDARAAARCWRSHGMGVAVAAAAGSEAAASRTAALASGQRRPGLRTGCLHSPASDFRTRLVRTWPGPVSTKLVTPRASSARITSSQRTGSVIARTSSAGMSSNGSAVTHESTGTRGSPISVSFTSARKGSTAGSISGEWKAPATGSRLPRTPRSFSCASASSSALRAPERTSWSGALSLAIATPVAAATSAMASRLPSRARTAVMPPSPVSSAASCMRRPRAATSRRPSSALRASAATSAVISPSEWPAITSGSTPSR